MVLEITEHEQIDDYDKLLETLMPLRARGLRIAIDDAGAGYSSFRHILLIKPDVIKLDISITRAIDEDPSRRALATALISFAAEIDATLVAEGVETAAELRDAASASAPRSVRAISSRVPARLRRRFGASTPLNRPERVRRSAEATVVG